MCARTCGRTSRTRSTRWDPIADGYKSWVDWVDETGGDPPRKAVDLVLRLTSDAGGRHQRPVLLDRRPAPGAHPQLGRAGRRAALGDMTRDRRSGWRPRRARSRSSRVARAGIGRGIADAARRGGSRRWSWSAGRARDRSRGHRELSSVTAGCTAVGVGADVRDALDDGSGLVAKAALDQLGGHRHRGRQRRASGIIGRVADGGPCGLAAR